VEDPLSWHAANLSRNRRHYSALGAAGPRAVVALADALGVGVHFNPFVRLDTQARAARSAQSRARGRTHAHTHVMRIPSFALGAQAQARTRTHARTRQTTIKYGVIGVPRLLSDLRSWDALYVAGRMQKPVATLAADARVSAAAEGNLRAALACALLLLPVRACVRVCAACVRASCSSL
jgi:translocator assembly and maintenance protein 41